MTKVVFAWVLALGLLGVVTPATSLPRCAPSDTWCDVGGRFTVDGAGSVEEILAASDYDTADADVLRLYQAFFNRSPDVDGAIYWISQQRAGMSIADIAEAFTTVPEFTDLYASTTNAVFVERIYTNVLGRRFDQGGYAFWLDRLETNEVTRAGLVIGVTQSPEFKTQHPFTPTAPLTPVVGDAGSVEEILAASDYDTADADVLRLYQAFFNRSPDVDGAIYWISQQRAGMSIADIAEAFTTVPEFTDLYASTTNAVFVERIYTNVLGRRFDQGGYAFWLDRLETNEVTRAGLVIGVTQSPEFKTQHPFTPIPQTNDSVDPLGPLGPLGPTTTTEQTPVSPQPTVTQPSTTNPTTATTSNVTTTADSPTTPTSTAVASTTTERETTTATERPATTSIQTSSTTTAEPVESEWQGWESHPATQTMGAIAPTGAASPDAVVVVDLADQRQSWLGVGAAITDSATELLSDNAAAFQLLFDPNNPEGAQLDIARLPLSSTDFSSRYWAWRQDSPPAESVAATDLAVAAASINPDLSVVVAPWSAPAEMKTTQTLLGGALRDGAVDAYAIWLVDYVSWLAERGLDVAALSLGNEPGHSSSSYPTMTMGHDQQAELARIVRSQLANEVQLWAHDHNWEDAHLAAAVVAQADGAFDAVAFHCYGGDPSQMGGFPIPVHLTECTGTNDTWDSTFEWDARNLVVGPIEAGSSSLTFWNAALDQNNGPKAPGGCEECRGLLTIDAEGNLSTTPEFHPVALLSRAADPGAYVLGTTSTSTSVLASSFVNPDGTIGVFGYNANTIEQLIEVRVGDQQVRFLIQPRAMFAARSTGAQTVENASGAGLNPGDVVRTPNGAVFVLTDQRTHRWIPDQPTSRCTTNDESITDISYTDLGTWTPGPTHSCFDPNTMQRTILSHPNGDSHLIDAQGIRHWIPSAAIFFCLVDRGHDQHHVVDRQHIDRRAEGPWATCDG